MAGLGGRPRRLDQRAARRDPRQGLKPSRTCDWQDVVLLSAVEVGMIATRDCWPEAERLGVGSGEREAVAELDEDGRRGGDDRVRRARKKYLGQYRRQAASKVGDVCGRGKAYAQNQRARDKAEV